MAQELTFNITEDIRRLKRPTTVKDFQLSFGHTDQGPADVVIGDDGNIVQGRYGDSARQVFVNVVQGKNNEPVDITGYLPEFNGCIPDAEHIVIDNWDGVLVDPRHGRFRFDFPIQAFTVAGSYKQAYFRLVQNGTGKTLATLEFDMQVLEDFVYSNIVPQNYVTPYLDMINKLKDAYTNFVGKTQDSFDQAKKRLDDIMSTVEDKADTVEQRLKIDEQALAELSKKIDEKGLFTQAEADAFKQLIIQMIKTQTINVFDSVDDMKAYAPLIAGDIVITQGWDNYDDGHGAYWNIRVKHKDEVPDENNVISLDNGMVAERNSSLLSADSLEDFLYGYTIEIKHNQGEYPIPRVFYYEDAIGTEINGLGSASHGLGEVNVKYIPARAEYKDANTILVKIPRNFYFNAAPKYQLGDWYLGDENRTIKIDLGFVDDGKAKAGDGQGSSYSSAGSGYFSKPTSPTDLRAVYIDEHTQRLLWRGV